MTEYDFGAGRTVGFEATYLNVTTSYTIMPPIMDDTPMDTLFHAVYLGMRDTAGNYLEVPCTYLVADIIHRHYGPGTPLTLYIAPRVRINDSGDPELLPLVIGADRRG